MVKKLVESSLNFIGGEGQEFGSRSLCRLQMWGGAKCRLGERAGHTISYPSRAGRRADGNLTAFRGN